jgi:hypothetical protein
MPKPKGTLKDRLVRYRLIRISVIGRKSGHCARDMQWEG